MGRYKLIPALLAVHTHNDAYATEAFAEPCLAVMNQ